MNLLLLVLLPVLQIFTPVTGQTTDALLKPIVTLHSQVHDSDGLLRLVVDYVQGNNLDLQIIFNNIESDGILSMFEKFSTIDNSTLDSAFAALDLNITCFKNLFNKYPIDYQTFLRFGFSLPHLLNYIVFHVGGASYGHMWESLLINANQITTYQVFKQFEELFNLVQTQGTFTDETMANALSYFTVKTITQRIYLFNGLVNMTAVQKFVEIYQTDDFIEFINTCGIEPQNLVNALKQLPEDFYLGLKVTESILDKLDEQITFGTIIKSNQIVSKLHTKAFDLQDKLQNYCDLVAVTSEAATFKINNSTSYQNYTILETSNGLPAIIPFANTSSKITSKYCTYYTSENNQVSIHSTPILLEAPYAWVAYVSGISEDILDGTPLICKNTNNQLILFGLSMHDFIYPANNSVRFDLLRRLEYQNVVAGTADRIIFTSGISSMQQAIEQPLLHNAIVQSISDAGENVIGNAQNNVEDSPIVKGAKDSSDKIIDSALQSVLLSDNTLQLTDDVGNTLHSVQALPAQGVDVVSNAASSITDNEAVKGVGDTITGAVKGPTETLGNTAGQFTGGVLDNAMSEQLGGALSSVGGTAEGLALGQVSNTLMSVADDAIVGSVVGQTGTVLNTIQSANVAENITLPNLPVVGNSNGLPTGGLVPVHSLNVPVAGLG